MDGTFTYKRINFLTFANFFQCDEKFSQFVNPARCIQYNTNKTDKGFLGGKTFQMNLTFSFQLLTIGDPIMYVPRLGVAKGVVISSSNFSSLLYNNKMKISTLETEFQN